MKFTILGASGFIGSHLAEHLRGIGAECFTPSRDDPSVYENKLGHVVYCIGLTANFRERPYDTVRAHICQLLNFLERTEFESFLYLSSTRVYRKAASGQEDAEIGVNPSDPGDLYNLSKLMGESACFASRCPNVRVVRLSNVFGSDVSSTNFLSSIIKDAVDKNRIVLEDALESEKDYISITDVVRLLPHVAFSGQHRLYNVASGMNVSNHMLLENIQRLTGCGIEIANNVPTASFPKLSIARIQNEFEFSPSMLIHALDELILRYKNVIYKKRSVENHE